jgi:YVTN family beta-propeller protein
MGAPSSDVFVSYRRLDTAHLAGRIFDRLTSTFGPDRIFMDVDTLAPGIDFAEAIEREIASAAVVIALIGPRWSTLTDESGRRRLDDPADYVARELGAALARGIRVIPALVDGAAMPDTTDLPTPLHELTKRNAIRIDHDTFRTDITALLDAVRDALTNGREKRTSGRWRLPRIRRWWYVAAAVLILGAAGLFLPLVQPGPSAPRGQESVHAALITVATIGLPVQPADLVVTPNGARLYVIALAVDRVFAVNAFNNTVQDNPIPVGRGPAALAVSPDGAEVYVANSSEGTVSRIDTSNDAVVDAPIPVGQRPEGMVVSWNGAFLYVANAGPGTITVVDLATRRAVGEPIKVGAIPRSMALSRDGRRLYVASQVSGFVSVIDTSSRTVIGTSIPVKGPGGLALNAEGDRLYVTSSADNTLVVVDTSTNKVIAGPVDVGSIPGHVAVSGSRVYVANRGAGTVSVLDAATGAPIGPPIDVGVNPVDVEATADRVYVSDSNGAVWVGAIGT